MNAPAATFLTPRAGALVLRSARTPSRQTTVNRGDPLLVTEQLGEGFVEVDWQRERWYALGGDLEPWRGAGASAAGMAPAQGQPQAPGWPQAQQPAGYAPGGYPQSGFASPYGQMQSGLNLPLLLVPISIAVCAVVVLAGSVSTWVRVLFIDVKGIDVVDGKVTLVLALVAGILAVLCMLLPQQRIWLTAVALAALLISAAIGIYDWIAIQYAIGGRFGVDISGIASVGWGLIAVSIGSVIGVVVCVVNLVQRQPRLGTTR